MSETVEILEKAKARVEKAWHQGDYAQNFADPDGCAVCAHGAVMWAYGRLRRARTGDDLRDIRDIEQGPAIQALHQALPPPWFKSVVEFNDDPTTTKADVLALFDRAIELAEQ